MPHLEELLKQVISGMHARASSDPVARALLCFLVRISNTWRTILTLRLHTPDDDIAAVDAGALIRVMYDAYLQALYIVYDPASENERARMYLDFEHVERKKLVDRMLKGDHFISDRLKSSPLRDEGTKRVESEYERVKDAFLNEKRQDDGTIKRGPGTRSKWYKQDLASLAKEVGKEGEHDLFIAPFHGCVHSSAYTVQLGPAVNVEHALSVASSIVGELANLCVPRFGIPLNPLHKAILDSLCRFFHPPSADEA